MSTLLIEYLKDSHYSGLNRYLSTRHFTIMMAAAMLLHLLAVVGYDLLPKPSPLDVPVRVLNIKLADVPAHLTSAAKKQTTQTAPATPRPIPQPMPEQPATKPSKPESASKPAQAKTAKVNPNRPTWQIKEKRIKIKPDQTPVQTQETPKRYVRDIPPATPKQAPKAAQGSSLGNSSSDSAEVVRRYEQVISLWINQHRVYPAAAKAARQEGKAILRLRIDRQGNILFYRLDRSTGSRLLDRAIIDMLKRANPVPAVPVNYPAGALIEFLIPINFKLQG